VTAKGDLRLRPALKRGGGWGTARWGSKGVREDLIVLDLQDNAQLIYDEFGVYNGPLGIPCDDM